MIMIRIMILYNIHLYYKNTTRQADDGLVFAYVPCTHTHTHTDNYTLHAAQSWKKSIKYSCFVVGIKCNECEAAGKNKERKWGIMKTETMSRHFMESLEVLESC